MLLMAKKNPDRHKKPRKGIQMPQEWYEVAEGLAADRQMPVLWMMIDMLQKAASAAGRADLPDVPWTPKK